MKKKEEEKPLLHVRISKATKVVWEGEAQSISSINSNGIFDILPLHSNFITLIRKDPIVIKTENGEEKKYQFNQSVIFVNNNKVKIFSNIE